MRLPITITAFFLLSAGSLTAQERSTIATKTSSPPKIDGVLDDAQWQQAPVLTDFIQNFPTFGLKATKPTEVRVLYDDNSIYVGAMIFDDPGLIRKQITARDAESQTDVDYFSIFFDTYHDHQNGQTGCVEFLLQASRDRSRSFTGDEAVEFALLKMVVWHIVVYTTIQSYYYI